VKRPAGRILGEQPDVPVPSIPRTKDHRDATVGVGVDVDAEAALVRQVAVALRVGG
jgi:hypothetical protein